MLWELIRGELVKLNSRELEYTGEGDGWSGSWKLVHNGN